MQLRTATLQDHDSVMQLMQCLHPKDPVVPPAVSQTVFGEILGSGNLVITIAEQSDCVVGTCYVNMIPNLTRSAAPYAVIENVVTHPDFRRQGIGKALISHALDMAKTRGCYKAMLLTGGDKSVLEFYESCGMKSGVKTAFIERW